MATTYQTGSLAALISGKGSKGGEAEKSLFDVVERPIEEPIKCSETPKNPKKVVDKKGNEQKKKAEKRKRVPDKPSQDSRDEDEEEAQAYTQPSRKFKVFNEDNNKGKQRDLEKESRTVFVGNLPVSVTKKAIHRLFAVHGKIETIRIRGAARPDLKTTKKVAVITKQFHEKRSTLIAYVRFETVAVAKNALELNGVSFEDHVLRVDMAISGDGDNKTAAHDQSKAVYVGNLPFEIEEDEVRKHFLKCGKINDVRIVRDSQTGIGKGFCYVNFDKKESVETAITLRNGTKLNGRDLRVSRSVNRPKKTVQAADKSKTIVKKSAPKKIKRAELRPNFEGKKFDNDRQIQTSAKGKKVNKGDRKKKMAARKLLRK